MSIVRLAKPRKADTEIVIHDETYAWVRVIFSLWRWPALILFGFPADQNIYPAFHKFWKRFQIVKKAKVLFETPLMQKWPILNFVQNQILNINGSIDKHLQKWNFNNVNWENFHYLPGCYSSKFIAKFIILL